VTLEYGEKEDKGNKPPMAAATKAVIQARREEMVETKTTFETTTELEFNLEAGTTKFSFRQATL
jgi:hypothetical protein